ncbi:MAG TPA: succinate dehydrogenase, cytochrome b556 subunit [Steroidobacteraceae bacterium]|jgi:succinate dehydrogenase / fumarate reductase cytochrome b subunit|nr:succinate dehydrogenase, cytochrome b556 subunit [Steroidobacteraceae bacterium]
MAERPLSPFTKMFGESGYRWAYTMTLSILHRVTGVALVFALLGLVVWLIGASFGPAGYQALLPLFIGVPAKLVISLAVIALIYHFCNGLRHLAWDMGWGFERAAARRSAVLVVFLTAIASSVCILLLFHGSAP